MRNCVRVEKLRKGGFVYVDKTALIHRLVSTSGYYFFGRPRRFGKSLMISTLESYFEGRKDLFEGLAIEGLEKDWNEYPIFHIDLNNEEYNSRKRLEGVLNNYLVRWERIYGSEPSEESFGGIPFVEICRTYQTCIGADRSRCGNPD